MVILHGGPDKFRFKNVSLCVLPRTKFHCQNVNGFLGSKRSLRQLAHSLAYNINIYLVRVTIKRSRVKAVSTYTGCIEIATLILKNDSSWKYFLYLSRSMKMFDCYLVLNNMFVK